jgi:hypothetical protein
VGREMATDRLPATLMSNAREQHDGEISSSPPASPATAAQQRQPKTPHHPDRFCPAARPQRRRGCDGRAHGPRTDDHAVLVGVGYESIVADDPDTAVAAALALPASAATSIPLNGGQEPADGEAGGHGFFS